MEHKTNLILKKDNWTSGNRVIYINKISLGAYGTLLLVLDSSSPRIICHYYTFVNRSWPELLSTIGLVLHKPSFGPPTLTMQTLREDFLKHDIVTSLFAEKSTTYSFVSAKDHHSKVAKRLNRSFKDILNTFLDKDWRKKKVNPLKQCTLSFLEFGDLVKKGIEFYNNRTHRSLENPSLNVIVEAFSKTHENNHPNNVSTHDSTHDSSSLVYRDVQTKVLKDYDRDWERFFIDWLEESRSNHAESLSEIRLNQAEIVTTLKEKAAEALKQYETLYEKYHQTQKSLEKVQKSLEKVQKDLEKVQKDLEKVQKEPSIAKTMRVPEGARNQTRSIGFGSNLGYYDRVL